MSLLLSSFYAVLVSSTMGLPLRCVSSPSASSLGALLSWAPAVLGLFHAKVVSARLNPSHGTIDVRVVCNFSGSVSSQQKFEATDQHYSSRTGQHYSSWTDQCQTSPDRSVWSSDLLLFYFHGLFLSLSFSHCHFGLLFPILPTEQD